MYDDEELIQQSRNGNLRAFEQLYDKYKTQVYRVALAITNNSQAAEDILQECFLRLHAHIHRLDGSRPISPWLHRVTVNLAYNLRAKEKHRTASLESLIDSLVAGIHGGSPQQSDAYAVEDIVQEAIDSLDFPHRATVILYYLSDFSVDEIAYILDCPAGTVKSRLHYARNKLRIRLTGQVDGALEVAT